MSRKFDRFPITPLTAGRFWSWLARSEPGAMVEYHRGLLTFDRSPASELVEDERRMVARLADAALQAAEDGLVHLVQRRNGQLDFSYRAIKAGTTTRPRFAQPPRMASPTMLAAA
jgi:hypothetical protein